MTKKRHTKSPGPYYGGIDAGSVSLNCMGISEAEDIVYEVLFLRSEPSRTIALVCYLYVQWLYLIFMFSQFIVEILEEVDRFEGDFHAVRWCIWSEG